MTRVTIGLLITLVEIPLWPLSHLRRHYNHILPNYLVPLNPYLYHYLFPFTPLSQFVLMSP